MNCLLLLTEAGEMTLTVSVGNQNAFCGLCDCISVIFGSAMGVAKPNTMYGDIGKFTQETKKD